PGPTLASRLGEERCGPGGPRAVRGDKHGGAGIGSDISDGYPGLSRFALRQLRRNANGPGERATLICSLTSTDLLSAGTTLRRGTPESASAESITPRKCS